jgi:hypothetical protein
MFKLIKRAWIPLVIVIVVLVAGFTVSRIRTFFGAGDPTAGTSSAQDDTKPFNPKVVKYEITGMPGATADVNYLDLDAQPQRVDGVTLPWSLTLSTTDPSVFPNIVAQGNGDSITCRITVDDELKDTRTTDGVNAQTFCLVKSA